MEEHKQYKYSCDKCSYYTNTKLSFDRHVKSTLHITGQRKIRTDKLNKIFKCDKCNYETKNEYNNKTHYLNNHSTNEERKLQFTFYCEKCDFGCFTQSSYNIHIETKKHNIKTN